MIESWGPVIGAGIIVGGAAAVQLFIYCRTISERRKERERERINAVKDLYWGLRAIASQGAFISHKVTKIDPFYNFLLYPEDIDWLRQHFHKNGHLLSVEIHEAYHNDISDTRTRPRLLNPDNAPHDIRKFVLSGPVSGGNLLILFLTAKKELFSLDPDMKLPADPILVPKDQ